MEEPSYAFRFKKAFNFPFSFWLVSLLCMTFYSAIGPFQACATDFFSERYGMDTIAAGRLSGIITLISMCLSWVFGTIIYRIGRRVTFFFIGCSAIIPCYVAMAFSNINPWIPTIIIGFCYAMIPVAIWSSLPLLVDEKQLGTAYGLVAMVQNIGLFAIPIAVGTIRDSFGSYNPAMLLFSALGIFGVTITIGLKLLSSRRGDNLNIFKIVRK